MYGRGVAVSKSDFATYTFALRALEALRRPLRGTVELHFTYDEEFGGLLGPGYLLRTGATNPDLAIGAGFSYAIVTAHNGCLQLEVTVRGRSAHAAMPETGHDALAAAVRILARSTRSATSLRRQAKSRVRGHRQPNAERRPYRRRHQHQRRAGPDHVPARPAHDPGRGSPRGRAAAQRGDARSRRGSAGITVDARRLLLARALAACPGHERLVAAIQRVGTARSASPFRRRPARSTRTPGSTPKPASRSFSTAPGRAPSSRPMPSAPTRTSSSTISGARPSSSRAPLRTCCRPAIAWLALQAVARPEDPPHDAEAKSPGTGASWPG